MNSRKVTRGPLRVMRALWKVHLRVDKPVQPNRKMTCTTLWWQRVFTSTGLTEKHCWLLSKLYTLYWEDSHAFLIKNHLLSSLSPNGTVLNVQTEWNFRNHPFPARHFTKEKSEAWGGALTYLRSQSSRDNSFHSAWSLTQHTFPSKPDTSFWRQKPTWGNSSECYPLNHSFTPNPNLSVSTDDKLFLPQRAHSFFTLFIFQVFYPMFCFRADYTQRLRLYCQYFI